MRKISVFFTGFILIFISFIEPSSAIPSKKISITAKAAILVDCNSDEFVFSKNIDEQLACASTTKLLTALVALEQLGTETQVKISQNSWNVEPSKAGLKKGAYYTSGDLVRAALIASSNDACVALAEAVAGSEEKFAVLINEKAKRLGAVNSNFVTSSGLPAKDHYSTVYDFYLIARAALRNSFINAAMRNKKIVIEGSDNKKITLRNHNKLLFRWSSPLVLGKTGYTRKARHCYAGIIYYEGRQYAIVILKSRKPWHDIENLLASAPDIKIAKKKKS